MAITPRKVRKNSRASLRAIADLTDLRIISQSGRVPKAQVEDFIRPHFALMQKFGRVFSPCQRHGNDPSKSLANRDEEPEHRSCVLSLADDGASHCEYCSRRKVRYAGIKIQSIPITLDITSVLD